MPTAKANGLTIAYETAGDPRNPTILLVMGLGAQLTLWPDAFVEALAANGLHVVRYDNRDVGLSSDFDSYGIVDMNEVMMKAIAGKPLTPPYTVSDMANDGIGLLDALGIKSAHVVGLSQVLRDQVVDEVGQVSIGRDRPLVGQIGLAVGR